MGGKNVILFVSIILIFEISITNISADHCECKSYMPGLHQYMKKQLSKNLVIRVKQGRLRGTTLNSRKNATIYAFYNIPYAKPPLGKLRFEKPMPPEPWKGIWNATTPGPYCVQTDFTGTTIFGDEDCLHVNVFITDMSCCLKPVMVFIPGGGWTVGAGNWFTPQFLMDKDVVLVTMNYRLYSLGFLSTQDDVCPGNNGLKDQVAALKWVQDNIASFGGDPKSVTIFGQSAGAASVHYHMLSPQSQELFHRAISNAGSVYCPWAFMTRSLAVKRAKQLAELLHCPNTDSFEMVSCMKHKNVSDIIRYSASLVDWYIKPSLPFRPVIEPKTAKDAFLPDLPTRLILKSRSIHTVPWIIGVNSQDGCVGPSSLYGANIIPQVNKHFDYFGPILFYYGETSRYPNIITNKIKKFYFNQGSINNNTVTQLLDLFSDSWFYHCVLKAVSLHVEKGSAPVYFYVFDYRGSLSYSVIYGDSVTNYGVCHADDLLYLFPPVLGLLNSTTYSAEDERMVDYFVSWWTNFAKYGDPTAKGRKKWPRVTSLKNLEVAELNADGIRNYKGFLPKRMKFWNAISPLVLSNYKL